VNAKHLSDNPVDEDQLKPRRVSLAGMITDEEVGLGDVIKKATSMVGIRPCGSCAERAKQLNKWLVFTKGR
jgi:hypothetical protein